MGGEYSVSASTSSAAHAANQFGNVQQGDNNSGGLTNMPLILLGGLVLALIGGLVWIVSRN